MPSLNRSNLIHSAPRFIRIYKTCEDKLKSCCNRQEAGDFSGENSNYGSQQAEVWNSNLSSHCAIKYHGMTQIPKAKLNFELRSSIYHSLWVTEFTTKRVVDLDWCNLLLPKCRFQLKLRIITRYMAFRGAKTSRHSIVIAIQSGVKTYRFRIFGWH